MFWTLLSYTIAWTMAGTEATSIAASIIVASIFLSMTNPPWSLDRYSFHYFATMNLGSISSLRNMFQVNVIWITQGEN
jgi:hypothetical protein